MCPGQFVLVVQDLVLEAIFGGLCQVCVSRVGRQNSQFFSLDEDFETSPLKWFYIGWVFFHVMYWAGFHGSKYDSQSRVLDFVKPALVGLVSRSPRSGCILYGCS